MKTQRVLFFGVLVLALIHGMLYLTLVLPWDHYDEPTHFEYGWLIAARLRFPQPGDVDWAIRREISASMLEHGFQHEHMLQSALLPGEGLPEIGPTELNHPPLYYALIAVPLRLLRYADVRTQLYAARAISLLLYLVTVACAWGLGAEIAQTNTEKDKKKSTLKTLCVPFFLSLTVALVPGVADLMTAVNNDVGATAAFSVFLWCAVRAIRQRASSRTARKAWGALAGCTLVALLCPWIKNTAAPALLFLPLVWILALAPPLRRRQPRRTWVVAAIASVLLVCVGLGFIFSWGDAALWYRVGAQAAPTRQRTAQAPLGKTALAVGPGTVQLRQFLPQQDLASLRGQRVTLGAWIWSTQPVEVNAPQLQTDVRNPLSPTRVQVGPEPTFYAMTSEIPEDAPYLVCRLYAAATQADGQDGATVYYDGIVLTEGLRTPESSPVSAPAFDDPKAKQGTWNGRGFENHIRNASAQASAPYVRPRIERVILRYSRRSPSQLVLSVLDWKRSAPGYLLMAQVMLRTFWASFGWSNITLPGIWYAILGVVSLLCLAGALVQAVQTWRRGPQLWRRYIVLLGLAGIAIWANAVLRIHPMVAKVFMPAARYAYPAILPTMVALLGGSWALTQGRRRWLRTSLLCGEAVLAVVSLWTVAAYRQHRALPPILPLALLMLCLPAGWVLGRRENAQRAADAIRGLWGCLRTWWKDRDKKRLLAYGTLALIVLAGLLFLGNALRTGAAARNQVEPRAQAMREVNALAQELEIEQGTVGISAELHIPSLDLQQIDAELLYRLAPAEALICGPAQYDILVLPSNDGTQLTQQAVRALSQAGVPHVALREGQRLEQDSPSGQPGLLVAVPAAGWERPEDCPSPSDQGPEEWPPAPLRILDWEAPIPDRHRPSEIPPHPWDTVAACTESLLWLIQEDQTATYSRLQERGQKMQLGLRGSVQTAPCKLEKGVYRFEWNARLWCAEGRCDGGNYSQLQVSVWEHRLGHPPERIRTRILSAGQSWELHAELIQVSHPNPVSIKVRWLDGPGAPHLVEGQPQISLLLTPEVTLQQEPDLSLGQTLVVAWENTVRQLARR